MHAADFGGYSEDDESSAWRESTWSDENLANYLADPKAFLAGSTVRR